MACLCAAAACAALRFRTAVSASSCLLADSNASFVPSICKELLSTYAKCNAKLLDTCSCCKGYLCRCLLLVLDPSIDEC